MAALQVGGIVGALTGGFTGTLLADRLWLVLLIPALLVVAVFFVVLTKVEESGERQTGSIDPGGVALLTTSMLVITGGLTFVRVNGASTPWPWLVVLLGIVLSCRSSATSWVTRTRSSTCACCDGRRCGRCC